jgi:shikimate dehydrogenase
VIGWPIEQSLSPAMHNAAYQAMGLNWAYVPLAVPDNNALFALADAVRRIPVVGFNVTMPYKRTMLELCDEVATLAQIAGAVNTVHCVDGRLIGYNTDGRGLLESLKNDAGFEPSGATVAIIGAGGAAGAAVAAFILAKAARLTIVNRDVARAEALLERVSDHLRGMAVDVFPLDESAGDAVRSADLVVNATPVGMGADDPSPVPSAWLRQGQVVLDMVYRPEPTSLLRDAERVGARGLNGLGMLVAQGALAIDIWAGSERSDAQAPRDVMRAAAEAAMTEAPRGVKP